MTQQFSPSLSEVQSAFLSGKGNTIPVFTDIPADLLTPVSAYLKLSKASKLSFLLESVTGGERVSRHSFIGADPFKIIKTGPKESITGDPLLALEPELNSVKFIPVAGVPTFTGGAIGYVSYDCVQHFEPRTARSLPDALDVPESVFMFCDTLIVFDHVFLLVKVISHVHFDSEMAATDEQKLAEIEKKYANACKEIRRVINALNDNNTPLPQQESIVLGRPYNSNVGKEGYESFVRNLKYHIHEGDIIQAVPSQRLSRSTDLHPFNLYRRLRTVNPSPYMFYLDLHDFQIVGASPETLVKVANRVVETHPIAGTRRRGKTPEEDLALEQELLADEKERAEHVMLVDLGRNDVNRVCIPSTVRAEDLMHIERFSHVMHIVTRVVGKLRPECTLFDAFRSIFPAGTVSGAPKIRAVELIYDQEKEKRGIYAGAVGYWAYSGDMHTCIAIRTIVCKNKVAYLQAGAGIVFDSDPTAEYEETISKLNSNLTAIRTAEEYYHNLQEHSSQNDQEGEENNLRRSKRTRKSVN